MVSQCPCVYPSLTFERNDKLKKVVQLETLLFSDKNVEQWPSKFLGWKKTLAPHNVGFINCVK